MMAPDVFGVSDCTAYLNSVVGTALDEICRRLRLLDRKLFIRRLLTNYELAHHDRDVWRRTARANLALHDDKDATLRTIARHSAKLNACFIASRVLLEAAICECPATGGRTPGKWDLSLLMSYALRAFHMGGWSDAVYSGAMAPHVRVTTHGDVQMNLEFIDAVYEPFARAGAETQVKSAAEDYAELYDSGVERAGFASVVEPQFSSAWGAEFGVELDNYRTFVDELEDLGLRASQPVSVLPRSSLVSILSTAGRLSIHQAEAVIAMLSLRPRTEWRKVENPFRDKDWFPWRFRRRLSVLRRPFIEVGDQSDPDVMFAPGLVRESFAAMVHWFYTGEIPQGQASSLQMKKWLGTANNIQRTKFNCAVSDRMRELGWETVTEIKLTKALRRALDRNYGDIDVLAWQRASGRVLAIECKDLQYLKTIGEVAEQLSDFPRWVCK